MADAGIFEAGPDDLQQLDELAEDEHLMAFVAEFLDLLEQGVELGAGEFAVGLVDERGVAANLAEAEEAGENVETYGVECAVGLEAEEHGAGALELGIVEFALAAFEFDHDFIFGARRQIGGDLAFRAAEHEVTRTATEAFGGGGIFVGMESAERGLGAEEAGLGEGENAPEIEEAVLDGRAGEREAVGGGESARVDGGLAGGIFNVLRFVEDDDVPALLLQPLAMQAELRVVGDEERGPGGLIEGRGDERGSKCGGGERGGEARGLRQPAVHDAFRTHDEGAEGAGSFAFFGGGRSRGEMEEPRESLDGFAEAHVVGEDAAETIRGKMREKVETFRLVRAERGLESGGKCGWWDGGESGGAGAEGGGERGILPREGVGFGGELEGVEAVRGGTAGFENFVGAQAEAVERGGGFARGVGG